MKVNKEQPIRAGNDIFNDDYLKKASPELIASYKSAKPYKHCILENFTKPGILEEITKNLYQEDWYKKKNDLYDFKQTDDLKTSEQCGLRDLRNALYSAEFRGFLQSITGIELNDVVDISAHTYQPGGTLLCHDDELEGRRIAFIIYLVPDDWAEKDGGTLDLFDADDNNDPTVIVKSIAPRRNTMLFFEVGMTTWHQVSEVLRDRDRLSISGWFHGVPLARKPERIEPEIESFPATSLSPGFPIKDWVNEKYFEEATQQDIKEFFSAQCSIGLNDFLLEAKYQEVEAALHTADWKAIGPPQRRHYDSLGRWGPETETGVIAEFKQMFYSLEFLELVQQLTGQTITDAVRGEVRRFKRQDYTLVHDNIHETSCGGLDISIGFQQEDGPWKSQVGGFTTYLDEEDELLTLMPQKNALSLVLRDVGCMHFVKFITSSAPQQRFDFRHVFKIVPRESGSSSEEYDEGEGDEPEEYDEEQEGSDD